MEKTEHIECSTGCMEVESSYIMELHWMGKIWLSKDGDRTDQEKTHGTNSEHFCGYFHAGQYLGWAHKQNLKFTPVIFLHLWYSYMVGLLKGRDIIFKFIICVLSLSLSYHQCIVSCKVYSKK
jgi:hypothetical protein